MSSVSPRSSASQNVREACVGPVAPVAPYFLSGVVGEEKLTVAESELARLYYVALGQYYETCRVVSAAVELSCSEASSSSDSSAVVSTIASSSSRRRRRRRVSRAVARGRGSVATGASDVVVASKALDAEIDTKQVFEPGYCYLRVVHPAWRLDVRAELGAWPELGSLMALPLDRLVSIADVAFVMCDLSSGGAIHISDGIDGFPLKRVVSQVAVTFRTGIGTLGAAWVPADTGLSVSRACIVGGEVARVGGFWDAAFGYCVTSTVDFTRRDVRDVQVDVGLQHTDYLVYGKVERADAVGFVCVTSPVRFASVTSLCVEAELGCRVRSAYSLSADGTYVERYGCSSGALQLNINFDAESASRYFVFFVDRTEISKVRFAPANGKVLWTCTDWRFDGLD